MYIDIGYVYIRSKNYISRFVKTIYKLDLREYILTHCPNFICSTYDSTSLSKVYMEHNASTSPSLWVAGVYVVQA